MRLKPLLLICLMYCGTTQAETIHRCVDAGGKVSYQATPCAAGSSQAKTIETKTAEPRPMPSEAMPSGYGRPSYKQDSRSFQRRHEARLREEQYQEQMTASRERDEEAARERQAAYEKSRPSRYERDDPMSMFPRYRKEKKYLDGAPDKD